MNNFKIDTSPKLQPGFKTPEGYFEHFSIKIPQQAKTISLWKKNKRLFYSVAAVVLLSLSLPIINYVSQDDDAVLNNEIENYLTTNHDITDTQIAEFLEPEDLQNITINNNLDDTTIEAALIDNKNLEDDILN